MMSEFAEYSTAAQKNSKFFASSACIYIYMAHLHSKSTGLWPKDSLMCWQMTNSTTIYFIVGILASLQK